MHWDQSRRALSNYFRGKEEKKKRKTKIAQIIDAAMPREFVPLGNCSIGPIKPDTAFGQDRSPDYCLRYDRFDFQASQLFSVSRREPMRLSGKD